MSVELYLPKLGMSMEEGTLADWLVADGDEVTAGTPIYSIESDKSVHEIEAPASGRISLIGRVGETYPVGELIGRID